MSFHCLLVISLFLSPVIDGLSLTTNFKSESDERFIYSSVPTASAASNASKTCLQHTEEYLTALRSRLPWAVKMYESSGRLVEDLIYMEGSEILHHEPGLFDECLSVQSDGIPFQGQYCTVFFGLKLIDQINGNQSYISNTPREEEHNGRVEHLEHLYFYQRPSVGFCLPSTCSACDLTSAVSQHVGHRTIKGTNYSIVAIANENHCYTQEKINISRTTFDNVTIAVMFAFCLLGITVATATVHDNWKGNDSRQSFAIQLLYCFSARKNCKTLFSTEGAKDNLSCVNGIRVLSTCWIVLIHVSAAFTFSRLIYNRQMAVEKTLQLSYQFITNGLFAVDTFFLLSGLLVAFTQLRQLDQNNGVFNLKRFYLHRYIRLTPVYAALVAFISTLYPYVGTGPDWNFVVQKSKALRKSWWANLMYINNFVKPVRNWGTNPEMPSLETWYLACDMQMFLISPLFIYPIWRWKRAGIIWTALNFLVMLGISTIVFVVHNLPPTIFWFRPSDVTEINVYADKHYSETFARMPPYLIGILLGLLLYKTKDKTIHINKFLVAAGWIIATLLGLIATYGMFPYLDEATVPVIDPFIRVSYGVLNHSAWAITIGWIIFACTHGYGGFVHRFLSWKLFIPLSRLSYSVYLTHLIYTFAYISHLRKPYYFTEISGAMNFAGILVISFLLAFVVSVAVEMPFVNLDKLLFAGDSKSLQRKKKT
ncbi:nose resistant to fluoxetine protein 6-like isoform X2 [Daphnia pulicaria]|uniref:nose resistant to fluoxetine protein 6-like isoform X2 n=1 Tax=Daphnia pulicaria TaxID=35523 RepID=UPI001EEBDD33|nr:nose resistant to fluoxetine protein 6-like isoform X2 [Daphnia pulicaria]